MNINTATVVVHILIVVAIATCTTTSPISPPAADKPVDVAFMSNYDNNNNNNNNNNSTGITSAVTSSSTAVSPLRSPRKPRMVMSSYHYPVVRPGRCAASMENYGNCYICGKMSDDSRIYLECCLGYANVLAFCDRLLE